MTTGQIIVILCLALSAILSFAGIMFSEENNVKTAWGFVMLFITFLLIVIVFLLISGNDKLIKQVKGKCPEYEKIEVYKLKETK
jgi:hypothetical protein